jgi:hypothetical protein
MLTKVPYAHGTYRKRYGLWPAPVSTVVNEKTTAGRASFSAWQAQEYERSYRLAGVRLHIVLRRSQTTAQSNTPRPICRFQPYTPTVCETGVRRLTFCTGRHVVRPLARLDSAGQITDYSLHTIQQRENGEIMAEQGSGGRIRRQVRPVYTLPRTVRLVAAPGIRLFRQSGQLFAQYSPMVSTFDGSTAGLHDCWCRENVGAR